MFKFLFRGRKVEAKPETKRERFERVVGELNEMIAELPEKPAITIAPGTGQISFAKPEQFMDEALALPKPAPNPADTKAEAPEPPAKDVSAATSDDQVLKSKRPAPPVPTPPVPNAPTPRTPG